jgi:hypothetical protein
MKLFLVFLLFILFIKSENCFSQNSDNNNKSSTSYDISNAIVKRDSINRQLFNQLRDGLLQYDQVHLVLDLKDSRIKITAFNSFIFNPKGGLSENGISFLKRLSYIIDNKDFNLDLLVVGHISSSSSALSTFNPLEVSVLNASKIVTGILAFGNFPPKNIIAGGQGAFSPEVITEGENEYSLNNRIEIFISVNLNEFFSLLEPKYCDSVVIFTEPSNADKYLVKIDFWNTELSKMNDRQLIDFFKSMPLLWVGNSNNPFRTEYRKYMAITVLDGQLYRKEFVILPDKKNIIFINYKK